MGEKSDLSRTTESELVGSEGTLRYLDLIILINIRRYITCSIRYSLLDNELLSNLFLPSIHSRKPCVPDQSLVPERRTARLLEERHHNPFLSNLKFLMCLQYLANI